MCHRIITPSLFSDTELVATTPILPDGRLDIDRVIISTYLTNTKPTFFISDILTTSSGTFTYVLLKSNRERKLL